MAVAPDEARQIALSMPGAVEQDHHGRPSFSVAGKIFATLWSDDQINIMLDGGGILRAVAEAPHTCRGVWWGRRVAAVGIALSAVTCDYLHDLLVEAWEAKAPPDLRHLRD